MKTLYVIVILLFILSFFLLFRSNENLKLAYSKQTESLNSIKEDFLTHIFNGSFGNISAKLKIEAAFRDSLNVADIVSNKTQIVFRVTDLACSKCISKILTLIDSSAIDSKAELLILFSAQNPNFRFTLQRELKEPAIFYSVMYSALAIPFEKADSPYFFVLSKNGEMFGFHIPNVDNLSFTKDYLDEIETKYLNK